VDVKAPAPTPGDERERRGRLGLEKLRKVTQLMDQAFGIPGTKWRFGLDALFGLVPGLGDIAGGVIAVYGLRVARQLRAPPVIQLHMLTNIALDALIGTIPVIGDIFDFVYKAQTRNLAMLDDWLQTPHEARRRSRRGMLVIPLAILFVFTTLTILGVWLLFITIHWIATHIAN
jgi:uncharacterized protein DUF4112